MTALRVDDAAEPSAARTYRELHRSRVMELLGQWASGVAPRLFVRVDVSPQVLAEIGIGGPGATAPQLVAQVTVADMIAAGAIG